MERIELRLAMFDSYGRSRRLLPGYRDKAQVVVHFDMADAPVLRWQGAKEQHAQPATGWRNFCVTIEPA
jgi:hypothetical protein